MLHRIAIASLLAASGAFACTASTKCIPDVRPTNLTVVRGDVDAVLVSEFALTNGCIALEFDSLTRRSPTIDSTPKIDANGPATSSPTASSAAALHLRTVRRKLDSATNVKCAGIRTLRRIDNIPRATADGLTVPVSLDSLAVCIDGSCSRVSGTEVDNSSDTAKCRRLMDPFNYRDSALATARRMLQSAQEVVALRRRLFIAFPTRMSCIVILDTIRLQQTAARTAQPVSASAKETRFTFPEGNASPAGMLLPLPSWSDPRVPGDLALPRPANAGDFFLAETLEYAVTRLRSGSGTPKDSVFRYVSGVKYYQYRGFQAPSECDTAPAPTIVGDTLRLDGPSLQINNDRCDRMDIDGIANDYTDLLFAPRTYDWQNEITNGRYLPFVGDSVQAYGWKFTLDELMSTAPSSASPDAPIAFGASLSGRTLSIRLDRATTVRIASPSGQIMSAREFPAGISEIPLPRGCHGVLLVDAGSRSARVLVP